jgi:hypothetical protein
MENNLYQVIKKRFMDELNDSLKRHPVYKTDVKAYGKYHMGKERPQIGVSLYDTSATRINLSPDNTFGTLMSMVTITKVGNHPGTSIEWVWEDVYNISKWVNKENVTATLSSDRTKVYTSKKPITKGAQNPLLLTDIGQVEVHINGVQILPRSVDPLTGEVQLTTIVNPSETVEVSYFYKDVARPGFYFLEMEEENSFIITPMYSEDGEVVVEKTTGSEVTVQLSQTPVLIDFVLSLYTRSSPRAPLLFLDRDVDYTVTPDGLVTFLQPIQAGTTLYASYRWQGDTLGPFNIPTEYSYNDKAIKGVVLAFGSRRQKGDKMCVVLTARREKAAHVKGGHYNMTLGWKVFSRDPLTTSEIADHLSSDIWVNRRELLKNEGITIEDCTPSNESESVYDDATQAMYFESSLNIEVMTEWKKFIPYVIKLKKYTYDVEAVERIKRGRVQEVSLYDAQDTPEFLVEYPITTYPYLF